MTHQNLCGRGLLAAAVAVAALAGGAQAAAASRGPAAVINQFNDAFSRGDMAGAKATVTDDLVVIDEIAPHAWHGPGAFDAWSADLAKNDKAAGMTNEKVAIGATLRSIVDGDTAYVVRRVTYTYRQHGRRMAEQSAQLTVALRQEGGGWKIAGFAWAGTVPHAAVAAAPKAKAATTATPAATAAPAAKKP
jgi:ketosteroid isomerase-like protein